VESVKAAGNVMDDWHQLFGQQDVSHNTIAIHFRSLIHENKPVQRSLETTTEMAAQERVYQKPVVYVDELKRLIETYSMPPRQRQRTEGSMLLFSVVYVCGWVCLFVNTIILEPFEILP